MRHFFKALYEFNKNICNIRKGTENNIFSGRKERTEISSADSRGLPDVFKHGRKKEIKMPQTFAFSRAASLENVYAVTELQCMCGKVLTALCSFWT